MAAHPWRRQEAYIFATKRQEAYIFATIFATKGGKVRTARVSEASRSWPPTPAGPIKRNGVIKDDSLMLYNIVKYTKIQDKEYCMPAAQLAPPRAGLGPRKGRRGTGPAAAGNCVVDRQSPHRFGAGGG